MQEVTDHIPDFPASEDEGAEKSGGWMKRVLLFLFLMALGLVYPVLMVMSHKVTNRISSQTPVQVWADPKVGTAIEVLERELYFGWASSQPVWHPQARLTAMPAFQEGIGDVFSAFAARRAEPVGDGERDSDLWRAHTLLLQLDDKEANDRVRAAIEALRRFDGRKARSLLEDRSSRDLLQRDLEVFRAELSLSIENLRSVASQKSRGVFNREDVRLYYHTKGELHAIAMLLKATNPDNFEIPGFRQALDGANLALARAGRPTPITVSNPQPGDFSLGGNDIMVLAYLALEADRALARLEALLSEDADDNAA